MNILTHKRPEFANIFMDDLFRSYSDVRARSIEGIKGFSNYMSMIEGVDNATNNLALSILRRFIEKTDLEFRNSPERIKKYHVKSTHKRTIMTVFGPLTFNKTFYTDKYSKRPYCYVDDFFGFEKYGRFDIHVKSLVLEACSDMSMAAAGRKVSGMIGRRTGTGMKDCNISRQTARTIVRKFNLPYVSTQIKDSTPDTLFIMMDEKFIPLQREPDGKAMVHHAVVFESIELVRGHTKRKELVQKRSFASRDLNVLNMEICDYIYGSYDAGKIRDIYVMGDGAKWIRASAGEYSMDGCRVLFALDKFHFLKALKLIFLDKEKEDAALAKVLDGDRRGFFSMCEEMLSQRPDRSDIITQKTKYIRNNWNAARLSYRKNLKCCMEGQISHNIAAVLTARPGAYSLKTLDKLLELRTAYCNGADIKKMYLDSFSYRKKKHRTPDYDFSIFDMFYGKETSRLGRPENINFLSGGYA